MTDDNGYNVGDLIFWNHNQKTYLISKVTEYEVYFLGFKNYSYDKDVLKQKEKENKIKHYPVTKTK